MKGRLTLVVALASLWIAAVIVRLVELQVVHHPHYVSLAERQQQQVVEISSSRGTIYDARGRALAVSVPVDSAYAEPGSVGDPKAVARAVAEVVPEVDAAELAATLARDKAWVWVARKLDAPQSEALHRLRLPGIGFVEETKRYYPNRELAASVLGFVGMDDHGLAGLEQVFDHEVAGRPIHRTLLRDARRETAAPVDEPFAEAEPGRDLVLTLDAAVQHIVEQELQRAVEEHQARWGSAVLLDPSSGAVLAMATYPGFDPNRFNELGESRWRNRAIQDAYEPGSTFKVFTAAAALEANLFDPSDQLDCLMGEIWIDRRRIRDHKPFGLLTFRDVIAKSSNVGAIKVGLRVGGARLAETIRGFGFGRLTGIDLPGENAGQVHPLSDRNSLATAYVSFGQGLSLTPLQLANAVAAVAGGGTLRRPYVVASIGGGSGEPTRYRRPEVLGRPLSEATARQLERILEGVASPEGTGQAARIPGYRVAGKTGTAQTAEPGGYSSTRFVASFVGFAPARDPALVAAVVIDEPRLPAYHGGQVAAPAFRAMVERTLRYLDVPPDRDAVPSIPEILPLELPRASDRARMAYHGPPVEPSPEPPPGLPPDREGGA